MFFNVFFSVLILNHITVYTAQRESDIIGTSSGASSVTVAAKYNETLQAGDVIYYEHPFAISGP
jgi:hypothetical protein